MPLLELDRIKKSWSDFELELNLELGQDEIIAISGPSGCGKSSTLLIIAGILKPDEGDIRYEGRSILRLEPWERGIGIVFQQHALFPHMNVIDNIAYPLACKRVARRERRKMAEEYLEMIGLGGFGKRNIDTLSGGEAQRVALARTLAMKPRIILFDEALSSLDAEIKISLMDEILTSRERLGFSAIWVSHDIEEARKMASRIYFMKDGRMV